MNQPEKEPSGVFRDATAAEHKYLFKAESIQRAKDVSNVSYKLTLALLKGGKTFHGHVSINFDLSAESSKSDNIFVDYKGKKLQKLVINGRRVTDGNPFREHRIYLPEKLLKEGANEIRVQFESSYVRDCQGMQYFVDKEDGEEYLYSQFEAADAHMVFPCFD